VYYFLKKEGYIIMNPPRITLFYLFILAEFFLLQPLNAQSSETIVGDIRVQAFSENLIRIEQRGPKGFDDRNTFTVVDRNWHGAMIAIQEEEKQTILTTSQCRIEIPNNSLSLDGILISLNNGKAQYQFKGLPAANFLPGPINNDQFWLLADNPRLFPPEWGATPAPEKFNDHPTSGWDTTNNAQDVYVFILEQGQYGTFKKDFLKLTGPTPLPPLFAFGLWNSKYHPYSEETALQTIDTFRQKQIPLDMFVVDTDWRRGASHGYAVNDSLFPDMKRFIDRAHEKHVRLMYNDHPEAKTVSALAPAEIQYRWNGLTGLLNDGMDIWWYDRNWSTGLLEPMPGISKEVWGMCLYHDITEKFRPDKRPLIMSNVDGIDNGLWNKPSHPASHRFPVWWTGDQKSRWEYLEMGVANGVNSGIYRMMPYVNEDLGGHTPDNPEPDQYIRWVQFGVFSPVTRLHCTVGLTRYPWDYGEEAEHITSEYIRLRYRLLPTLYTAAHRAYEDGTPIMRRCDLEWPDKRDAARDKQFLFGEDLLIVPFALSKTKDVPLQPGFFKTLDGKPGLTAEYFDNQDLKGKPVFVRVDSVLNFIMGTGSPDPRIPADHFSVRWTGIIHAPKNGTAAKFKLISDDGVRVWIDDSLIVDAWHDQAATDFPIAKDLISGHSYSIKIEYFENMGGAHFQAIQTIEVDQTFKAWIPPGIWHDIWTGNILKGPKLETLNPRLWKCPIYVRDGGIVLSLPQMQYTTEHPWDTIIVDAFVPIKRNTTTTRVLYEDDGLSPDYQKGVFRKTPVTLLRHNGKVELLIDKVQGSYNDSVKSRDWIIRLNLPVKCKPGNVKIDGKMAGAKSSNILKLISKTEQKEDAMPFAGAGSKPRANAGSILELNIHQQNIQESIRVSFNIK
jgi:alpha-glucosidase (family GH31 glycosyl hydrolase)